MTRKLIFFLGTSILYFLLISPGRTTQPPADPETLYRYHEQKCIESGWEKIEIRVGTDNRKVLLRVPRNEIRGAVILLHGGSGSYSNFCSGTRLGMNMVQFSSMALDEGFAVFSLDSRENGVLDNNGNDCGKRWQSEDTGNSSNQDLEFIQKVVADLVPSKIPSQARNSIFMSGISNGGYMTILASSRLSGQITAFAPVSAGSPWSVRMDCERRAGDRANAPGRFFHKSGSLISSDSACSDNRISLLPEAEKLKTRSTPFKQFHHRDDGIVDYSCMEEAGRFLTLNGFRDEGAFIVTDSDGKALWKHFWLGRYNHAIIQFFRAHVK